jgi:hypothetical protein
VCGQICGKRRTFHGIPFLMVEPGSITGNCNRRDLRMF